jgi:Cytochrome C1 family
MAKDVSTFLSWAAEPEHDERKKIGIKAVILFSTLTALSLYVKRFKWSVIKNRKIGELLNVTSVTSFAECTLVYNRPVDKTH